MMQVMIVTMTLTMIQVMSIGGGCRVGTDAVLTESNLQELDELTDREVLGSCAGFTMSHQTVAWVILPPVRTHHYSLCLKVYLSKRLHNY